MCIASFHCFVEDLLQRKGDDAAEAAIICCSVWKSSKYVSKGIVTKLRTNIERFFRRFSAALNLAPDTDRYCLKPARTEVIVKDLYLKFVCSKWWIWMMHVCISVFFTICLDHWDYSIYYNFLNVYIPDMQEPLLIYICNKH